MEAFLRQRPELAMYPLGNLAAHGVSGTGHTHATTYWIDDLTQPTTVLGITEGGMGMVFAPGGADAEGCATVLRGKPLAGITGQAQAVRAVLAAAELTRAPTRLNADEPQFMLSLDDLIQPDGPGTLVPVETDVATAIVWRHAFEEELSPPATPPPEGRIPTWITAGHHVFLMIDGQPAAMTGFNAALPDIVQVGGVYTPPATRNRGLARRAVGRHLAQARDQGVARATLFAASDAAVACYLPLGFRRIGEFAIVLFQQETTAQ